MPAAPSFANPWIFERGWPFVDGARPHICLFDRVWLDREGSRVSARFKWKGEVCTRREYIYVAYIFGEYLGGREGGRGILRRILLCSLQACILHIERNTKSISPSIILVFHFFATFRFIFFLSITVDTLWRYFLLFFLDSVNLRCD